MLIIDRYLIRQVCFYFAIVLVLCVSIYLAVDFFERIDNFIKADLPFSRAIVYFQAKIPFIVSLITPLGVLLAVQISFGLMHKNREIIALRSGGVSVYVLFKPILAMGVIFSVLLFGLNEGILPAAKAKENQIWEVEVKENKVVSTRQKNIWIKGNRQITHIKYYHPGKQRIFGISCNFFDSEFRISRRVDARWGEYAEGRWILHKVIEQVRRPETEAYQVSFHDSLPVALDFTTEDLQRVVKKSEEMSLPELWEYIHDVEKEGYDATLYRVDLQAKIAYPIICLILSMVGSGLALRGYRTEGLASALALGIGIAFIYWIVYSFCLSLGYGELLPPSLAAWMANIIFACFGFFTLLNAQ